MHELMVVGENQQSGGVLIQSADGFHPRIAVLPVRGKKIVSARSFVLIMCADDIKRFVKHHENAVRVVKFFAVDSHLPGARLGRRVAYNSTVYGDLARLDHQVCL